MKSAQVYKEISKYLSPIFKEHGFKKISSSKPKWFKQIKGKELHVYLQTDKYPWEPYAGCNVRVQVYLCEKDAERVEGSSTRSNAKRLFERGSEEIDQILSRNSVVIMKIKNINLEDILNDKNNWYDDLDELKLFYESKVLFIDKFAERDSIEIMMEAEMLYLDEEDVAFWGNFLVNIFQYKLPSLINECI
tara:strand:- start:549 stop:1121 length:573 start_codon:yes stop_codon:yes gene_type:complete